MATQSDVKQKTKARAGSIPDDRLLQMLEQMMVIRRFEEATVKGYQQKKIAGFLHTYIGSEAVGVGTMAHKREQDAVITSYRCHGLGLALGLTPEECMAELYGKVTGCARGKGGSMHFFSKKLNFLGGHGIVGGQYGPGIGAAFTAKYRESGGVSFIHFGDGATPQGTFHENLNLAALWDLPAIFVCEDNQYGMGTAAHRALSNTEISKFAEAYGVKGYRVNGMDLFEVHDTMGKVVEQVRKTSRPALVHMITYRFMGHSISDAGLYRSKEEVQEWRGRDAIVAITQHVIENGIKTQDELKELDRSVKERIKEAVAFADQSPMPPEEELGMHTYFDDLESKQWQ